MNDVNSYNELQIERRTLDRSSSALSLQDQCCLGQTHHLRHLLLHHFRRYLLGPNFFCGAGYCGRRY